MCVYPVLRTSTSWSWPRKVALHLHFTTYNQLTQGQKQTPTWGGLDVGRRKEQGQDVQVGIACFCWRCSFWSCQLRLLWCPRENGENHRATRAWLEAEAPWKAHWCCTAWHLSIRGHPCTWRGLGKACEHFESGTALDCYDCRLSGYQSWTSTT